MDRALIRCNLYLMYLHLYIIHVGVRQSAETFTCYQKSLKLITREKGYGTLVSYPTCGSPWPAAIHCYTLISVLGFAWYNCDIVHMRRVALSMVNNDSVCFSLSLT